MSLVVGVLAHPAEFVVTNLAMHVVVALRTLDLRIALRAKRDIPVLIFELDCCILLARVIRMFFFSTGEANFSSTHRTFERF